MSATAPTPRASTTAASDRLSRAIGAAAGRPVEESPLPEAAPTTRRARAAQSADRPAPVRDGARGAMAAPEAAPAQGTQASTDGAAQLVGAGQPMGNVAGYPTTVPSTYGAAPAVDPYAASSYASDPAAPEPIAPAPAATAATAAAGSGGWSAAWHQEFTRLQLAPADIEYLAQSGFSDADLAAIAGQLAAIEPIQPGTAPTPGVDAGSVASADGPLPGAATPAASAWTPEWSARFGGLMERMGMSRSEVREQLASIEGQPVTAEQLQVAYAQMEASLGAFDEQWKQRFETLMEELDTPAAERSQVLQQLASGGLGEEQLQQIHAQMEQSKPAWNAEWENRFKTLGLPEEVLTQLRDSGAPKQALEQQFQRFLDTKLQYKEDGRLERLEKAKATPEEKWGIMLEGLEGEKFDKAVEQVHSAHVPAWKRVAGFAVNLIPGVYAAQYLTGKDWITGEKIDRSNPLNIVGAVASGFAGFSAVRGAIQGVQGLSAANAAFRAGTQTAGLTNAVTAANLLPKFEAGLKLTDYVKSAIPLVNRFGEAGRLASVGRGYFQSMQLTAGAASLTSAAGGGAVVDQATRAKVLSELRAGASVQDAVAAGRSASTGYVSSSQSVVRDASRTGFLQGGVGKLGEGNRFLRGNGVFNFNPFRSTATIAETATEGVFSLGRGVNFASNAGLAQGLGLMRGIHNVSNPALAASAATRATGANQLMSGTNAQRMAGLTIADDVQRIETMRQTANWAKALGVTDGTRFRSLLQLGGSDRAVGRIAGMVERGGDAGYRFGRHAAVLGERYATFAAVPLVGGAAVGLTGKQMQPMWDYVKDRKEIQAREAEARAVAEQEAAELEQLYARQQAAASPPTGATAPASGTGAGSATASVPTTGAMPGGSAATSSAGAEAPVYVDPATGFYVDPQTGMRADPATGEVYDAQGQLIGNVNQPTG